MTYVFDVKEISYGSVSVEADNEEEAYEKAYDEYAAGNTCWEMEMSTSNLVIRRRNQNESIKRKN